MLEAATAGAPLPNTESMRSNWTQKYRGPTGLPPEVFFHTNYRPVATRANPSLFAGNFARGRFRVARGGGGGGGVAVVIIIIVVVVVRRKRNQVRLRCAKFVLVYATV